MQPNGTGSSDRGGQWRVPALVLLAAGVSVLITLGTRQSFGIFMRPMTTDLGWSRQVFSIGVALSMLLWGLGQPFFGALADKHGTGRVVASAGISFMIGVITIAWSVSPTMYYVGSLLTGVGIAGCGFAIVLSAVARYYPPEKRPSAFGVVTALGSLGQFAVVPFADFLQGFMSWSDAMVVLGVISLVTLPAAFVLAGKPAAPTTQSQSLGEALGEASRHSGFWYLTAGYFVCGFHVTFMGTHMPAYISDRGLDPKYGAYALALIGLFNIFGSFTVGYLGSRYRKKWILSFIYMGRAIAITAFILAPFTPFSVLLFASVMGLLWLSTVPITTAVVGQIFGLQYMGMLSGIVFLSHQIGAVLGVWLGGWLFDKLGSYELVWWLCAVLGLFAALINLPINDQTIERRPAAQPA